MNIPVMEDILSVLNNRERAVAFWVALGLIVGLRSKGIRSSLVSLAKAALCRPILTVVAAMVGYVSLVVLGFDWLALWDFGMLKDSVIWFLGSALVMVFNHEEALKDTSYFKKKLLASLTVLVVVEFLVNFYVFHILLELFLVPVLFFSAALLAYSKTRPEYALVKRGMEFVMGMAGFSLLAYATARLAADPTSFAAAENVKRFFLPIALTVLLLPFTYTLAVYSAYDGISLRVRLWIKDSELARYTRRQVFNACLFRLSRLNRFTREYAARLPTVKSRSDATKLIADFRASH
jgi:hypothetical protein